MFDLPLKPTSKWKMSNSMFKYYGISVIEECMLHNCKTSLQFKVTKLECLSTIVSSSFSDLIG